MRRSRSWLAEEPQHVRDARRGPAQAVLRRRGARDRGGLARRQARATTRRSSRSCVQIEAAAQAEGFTGVVLRFGIESSEWMVDWCAREAERLRARDDGAPRPARRSPRAPGARRWPPSSSWSRGCSVRGVADRLDPYGADDPDTESVIADQRLERRRLPRDRRGRAGRGRRPALARGRERIEALSRRLERTATSPRCTASPTPARRRSCRATGARPISPSRSSRPTTTRSRTPPSASPTDLDGRARRERRRRRRGPEAGQRAGRAGPAHRRAVRVPAAVRAVAAVLPQPRRRAAAAAGRRRWRSSGPS